MPTTQRNPFNRCIESEIKRVYLIRVQCWSTEVVHLSSLIDAVYLYDSLKQTRTTISLLSMFQTFNSYFHVIHSIHPPNTYSSLFCWNRIAIETPVCYGVELAAIEHPHRDFLIRTRLPSSDCLKIANTLDTAVDWFMSNPFQQEKISFVNVKRIGWML